MAIHNDRQRPSVIADELISVTIDATDLTAGAAEPLRSIISRFGRPVAARAFADFQQPGLSDLSVQLYQMGFTLVHCPTWPNGEGSPKPIVSDVMAQDLRDQLEELGDVEVFLLVATSRDYIAVANALRRHDKRVVVVAEEAKVCREFRLCADEFVALPLARPERLVEPARSGRSPAAARVVRSAEPARMERSAEPVRAERSPEPARPERPAEPVRSERPAEPVRSERPAEPARAEAPDLVRLPSDSEVLAEVRKIVAAEGICTPRRLARALCPVDRTPTGELRSRIANRIQALVDSGKLQRERLVVGGTSVETILAREDRNGRSAQPPVPETVSPLVVPAAPEASAKELEPTASFESVGTDGMIQGEAISEMAAESPTPELGQGDGAPVPDLDALVESVLRGPELSSIAPNRELDPEPEAPAAPSEPVSAPVEAPKRTRSRRRTSTKAAAPEPNGTA